MISNLFYVFQYDKKGIRQAFFWEWLHGFFIAAPSGILLVVLWELFKDSPDVQKIWIVIGAMDALIENRKGCRHWAFTGRLCGFGAG